MVTYEHYKNNNNNNNNKKNEIIHVDVVARTPTFPTNSLKKIGEREVKSELLHLKMRVIPLIPLGWTIILSHVNSVQNFPR